MLRKAEYERVDMSQQPEFEGNGRHMTLGPEGWDWF
jgi:hypothetical protein